MTEALAPAANDQPAASALDADALDADAGITPDEKTDPDAGLRRLAADTFGLARLRYGQLAGMRALVQGRDVLAVMPTGYGKSAIYQVAAHYLHRAAKADPGAANGAGPASSARRGPAVVVSPLIALQEDQLDGLLEDMGGEAAVAVNSGRKDSEVG